MVWKCQMTAVIEGSKRPEVCSLERAANDPVLGLELCWRELLERLSTMDHVERQLWKGVQLLGWADAVDDQPAGEQALQRRRMLDRCNKETLGSSSSQPF